MTIKVFIRKCSLTFHFCTWPKCRLRLYYILVPFALCDLITQSFKTSKSVAFLEQMKIMNYKVLLRFIWLNLVNISDHTDTEMTVSNSGNFPARLPAEKFSELETFHFRPHSSYFEAHKILFQSSASFRPSWPSRIWQWFCQKITYIQFFL